jgi:hypothetical protein
MGYVPASLDCSSSSLVFVSSMFGERETSYVPMSRVCFHVLLAHKDGTHDTSQAPTCPGGT